MYLAITLSLLTLSSALSPSTPRATPAPTRPTLAAFITPAPAMQRRNGAAQLLFKRAESCPTAHTGCGKYGHDDVCCPTTAPCTTDDGSPKHIACCPSGALCTGSIGDVSGSGGGGGATSGANKGQGGGSTVSNSYYAWAYIPETFSNKGECSSYLSGCLDEYNKCTASLVGGEDSGGVTIAGPGVSMGGGGSGLGQASAAEVCRSLGNEACRGISQSACATLASGTAAAQTTEDAAIVTPDSGAARGVEKGRWELGAGVVLGLVGGLVV